MLLLLVLMGLIVSVIVFYPQLENSIIFYPDKNLDDNPSNWNLSYKDVRFVASDGEKLHGWFFPLKGEEPVILFCHGNAGNMSHRIDNVRLLLEQKVQVFIFDYRGYGKSTGKPSEAGLYLDGQAAYDLLTNVKYMYEITCLASIAKYLKWYASF